jgi:hypothetical protein
LSNERDGFNPRESAFALTHNLWLVCYPVCGSNLRWSKSQLNSIPTTN